MFGTGCREIVANSMFFFIIANINIKTMLKSDEFRIHIKDETDVFGKFRIR